MFHVFILATCLTAYANAGYNQFFYSGFPTPVEQRVQYQQYLSLLPYQVQQYQSPVVYQSQNYIPQQHYVPQVQQYQPVQAYSAFPAFPTPHTTHFGYQQTFPQQFVYHTGAEAPKSEDQDKKEVTSTTTISNDSDSEAVTTTTTQPPKVEETPTYDEVEDDDSVVTNAAFRSGNSASVNPLTTTNQLTQNDNFRGFAYRNEFEGGRSHFVFITGPEAYRLQSQTSQQVSPKTSASDAVDTVATNSKLPQNDHSLDALIQYLEHPQVGVQRFYSINNALVSRRVEDEIPALPALPTHQFSTLNARTTLPITQPISPLFPLLRSSFRLDVETVKPTNEDNKKETTKEHEGSASTIEAKSVALETSTSPSSTTSDATTTTATEIASSTTTTPTPTTSTTTEKVEASTSEASVEKSTMGTIIVE